MTHHFLPPLLHSACPFHCPHIAPVPCATAGPALRSFRRISSPLTAAARGGATVGRAERARTVAPARPPPRTGSVGSGCRRGAIGQLRVTSSSVSSPQMNRVISCRRRNAGPSSAFAATEVMRRFFRVILPTCRTLSPQTAGKPDEALGDGAWRPCAGDHLQGCRSCCRRRPAGHGEIFRRRPVVPLPLAGICRCRDCR